MEHHVEPVLEMTADPLLRQVEFPLEKVFYPYGYGLRLRSNSPKIIHAAEQSWVKFAQYSDVPPLELCCGVAGDSTAPLPPLPAVRTMRHLLTVTGDAANAGVCDFATGFGYLWVTPGMLSDPGTFRYFYLDTLGYSLICERYFTGVHAACLSWRGRGVLLCGTTEAGKSTLAYACAKAGFTYICDDGSFLIRDTQDRVIVGNPHSLRLRPDATRFFPELAERMPSRRANGKMTIQLDPSELGVSTAARTPAHAIVLLHRRPSGLARLHPSTREAAQRHFDSYVYGRDESIREQQLSLSRLLDLPAVQLSYSNLDQAVAVLKQMLETGV